ncbi:MAG: hypothetical protein MJ007_01995 [Paludibacteraceae bacterium]|nr:hypothetical protein [Paludibacteraceae bacterium]
MRYGLALIAVGALSIPATDEGTAFVVFAFMGIGLIVEHFKEVKYGK